MDEYDLQFCTRANYRKTIKRAENCSDFLLAEDEDEEKEKEEETKRKIKKVFDVDLKDEKKFFEKEVKRLFDECNFVIDYPEIKRRVDNYIDSVLSCEVDKLIKDKFDVYLSLKVTEKQFLSLKIDERLKKYFDKIENRK